MSEDPAAHHLEDFGGLVERHYDAVAAVAYATTRDLALSEDVAQDTFVTAWRSLDRLRDPARVRPWLCGIARNRSKNALRRRRREVVVDADIADPTPSAIDGAATHETLRDLRAALAEIPAAYREPLVLFYWEDHSIAQVASALGITEEAAQKRLSRARRHVRDELATHLEHHHRGRRRASAAAAAIVAVLAARTGVAHAAPTTKGFTMSLHQLFKIFSVAVASTVVIAGVAIWRGRATEASPSQAPAITHRPGVAEPRADVPTLPSTANNAHAPAGAAAGHIGTPTAYELTVLAPTSVAVNLAGGASDTFLWQPPPPPTFARHVRGSLRDAAGRPVGGAVVIVGTRLESRFNSLTGDQGAVTAADGTFDVVFHSDAAASAIALHPRGWSSIVDVPAGHEDATISIAQPAAGTLTVHTRQAGAPIESSVELELVGGGLVLALATDAHGELVVPPLAPGRYRGSARASQLFGGGTSAPAVGEVVIEAGHAATLELALGTGTLVVASVHHDAPLSSVAYYLLPGVEHEVALDDLKARGTAGTILFYLLGGRDADAAAQFHDVTAGEHTLCIDAVTKDDAHVALSCREITVPADRAVLEVPVEL